MKRMFAGLIALFVLTFTSTSFAQADERQRPDMPVGEYKCRVSKGYKMRACKVTLVDGQLYLTVGEGNLIGMSGKLLVVDDRAKDVYFDARLTDERPFGCYSCQERCTTNPESCACKEIAPEASAECVAQQVGAHLKRKGNTWKGTFPYKKYWKVYSGEGDQRRVVGYEATVQFFELTLVLEKKK